MNRGPLGRENPGRERRGGPTLVQRMAERLGGGDAVPAPELAREVLGIRTAHEEAASAAIYALLAPDPRFRVDGEGRWSLVPSLRGLDSSLGFLDYAVVDVETTGGDPREGHRVIEVAVIEVRDGRIFRDFRSLVNPGRPIPGGVVQLTGIADETVADAPSFEEIAPIVAERLEGKVFVAQNAPFDRKFLEFELVRSLGRVPPAEILCTVRMARRLLPDLRKRNLDALARHFGIPIHGRHRAYGDAVATARIFLALLEEAGARGIRELQQLVDAMGGDLGSDRSDPVGEPEVDPVSGGIEDGLPPIPPPPGRRDGRRGDRGPRARGRESEGADGGERDPRRFRGGRR